MKDIEKGGGEAFGVTRGVSNHEDVQGMLAETIRGIFTPTIGAVSLTKA